jgi:hypothetical protein
MDEFATGLQKLSGAPPGEGVGGCGSPQRPLGSGAPLRLSARETYL